MSTLGPFGRRSAVRMSLTHLFGSLFHRIFYLLDSIELGILQLTVDFLNAADMHGLNNVSGFRVDRHRSARAFPRRPFGRGNEAFRVGFAARLLQCLENKMHAIKAADGEGIRVAAIGIFESRDGSMLRDLAKALRE